MKGVFSLDGIILLKKVVFLVILNKILRIIFFRYMLDINFS